MNELSDQLKVKRTIGAFLRGLRTDAGVSLAEAQCHLGKLPDLHAVESGKAGITGRDLQKLFDAYGVSAEASFHWWIELQVKLQRH